MNRNRIRLMVLAVASMVGVAGAAAESAPICSPAMRAALPALEAGVAAGFPKALFTKSEYLLNGVCLPKDVVAGAELMDRAAFAGHYIAALFLALGYRKGNGRLPRDPILAAAWDWITLDYWPDWIDGHDHFYTQVYLPDIAQVDHDQLATAYATISMQIRRNIVRLLIPPDPLR